MVTPEFVVSGAGSVENVAVAPRREIVMAGEVSCVGTNEVADTWAIKDSGPF